MAFQVSLFPKVTKSMISKMEMHSDGYSFSYLSSDSSSSRIYPLEFQNLEGDPDPAKGHLTDPRGEWTIGEKGLRIQVAFSFTSPSVLYGIYGVTPSNGEVSLALQWHSKPSGVRGVFPIGVLPESEGSVTLEGDFNIEKGTIRGSLDLAPVFYISKSLLPDEKESYLACTAGMMVGELSDYKVSLSFEGDKSVFPYYEGFYGDDPLWKLSCNWVSAMDDMFEDSVGIYINKNHPRYKYLNHQAKDFDLELFCEIIAHALFVVISKLKDNPDEWEAVTHGGDLVDGSVASAIRYYYSNIGEDWNWNSADSLDQSLRNYIMNRFKSYENSAS